MLQHFQKCWFRQHIFVNNFQIVTTLFFRNVEKNSMLTSSPAQPTRAAAGAREPLGSR
jgi:hypothetical protein